MLGVVSIALFLITIDASVLFTALPTLSEELAASASEQLWILNAYTVVMSGLLLGAGTLGDRLGHRRLFLVGLAIFGVASAMAAYAPNPEVLIAARALLAVGAAPMMPATLAIIRTTFTDTRERNLAIAVWSLVSVVGAIIGPVLGGLLLTFFFWGSVFLINIPIVILAIVLGIMYVPRDAGDSSRRWDWASSLLATIALGCFVLTIKEFAHSHPSWGIVAAGVGVAGVTGAWFLARQRSSADPLLPLDVFRIPRFTAGVVTAITAYFPVAGISLVLTQRSQMVAGHSALEAGALMATMALGSIPSTMIAGALLHRTGERRPIVYGLALGAVGALICAFTMDNLAVLIPGLILIGIGMGGPMAVASAAIVTSVPESRAGMASSVEEVSYELGNVLSATFMGAGLILGYSLSVDLPAGAPAGAGDSLSEALRLSQDPSVLEAARSAYDVGAVWVIVLAAAVAALGAVIVQFLLRKEAR